MDFTPKKTPSFVCESCHFKCFKNSDYLRHIHTVKHINRTKLNFFTPKNAADVFCCKYCKKEYKARNSLWYHEKKCKNTEENIQITEEKTQNTEENITIEITEKKPEYTQAQLDILVNLFKEQLRENKEMKELIIEQQKKILEISAGTNITNNNNNNTNCNNTNNFNLNFFLNETCKDASNITDFVNGIQLGLDDFERFGSIGYAGSISNVLVRELKALDVTKRPIHCSDLKRDVLHIKDNDTWVKDDDKKLMKRAILSIEHKNIQLIPEYAKAYPEVNDSTNKRSDQYDKMMYNSMGEYKDEDNERNYSKITHNVAKETVIDKTKYS